MKESNASFKLHPCHYDITWPMSFLELFHWLTSIDNQKNRYLDILFRSIRIRINTYVKISVITFIIITFHFFIHINQVSEANIKYFLILKKPIHWYLPVTQQICLFLCESQSATVNCGILNSHSDSGAKPDATFCLQITTDNVTILQNQCNLESSWHRTYYLSAGQMKSHPSDKTKSRYGRETGTEGLSSK